MNWTIPELLQFSGGYWGACALHAGVKLDVFSSLADGAKGHEAVAQRSGLDARGTAMLLDALAAINLLVKATDSYALTPFAADCLVRSAPGYLGHIIMHHHHLMESWAKLPEALRSGAPVRGSVSHGAEEEVRESFLMGMFNLASQLAPQIAARLDLAGRRRLLDLGGGPGTYAVHFCLQNPELTATIYDLPTSREFAGKVITRFGLEERVSFHAGDFDTDGVPTGFDVAWLSHVLHSEGPQGCINLLAKGVSALEPGGLLLVQEFILNDDKDGPVFPALFSLNMLVGTPEGRSYSERELVEMLTGAGLRNVRRLPAELPNGAGIMAGDKP
ncbi:MAG: SAM-dependent methyltransferase [Geobacter sp.]|nr:SAM-dependent methyltransferase [Geobacter sp.]